MRRMGWGWLCGLLLIGTAAQAAVVDSVYTKLALEDPPCPVVMSDEESGSSVNRCDGIAGYQLLVQYGDDRMSLTVVDPAGGQYPLNLWQEVSNSFSSLGDKAEWRVAREGRSLRPFALIVRFNAEDPNTGRPISYLTVSKVTPSTICLTDIIPPMAKQNEQARAAAGQATDRPCIATQPAPPALPPPDEQAAMPYPMPVQIRAPLGEPGIGKIVIPQPEREPVLSYAAKITAQDRVDGQGRPIRSVAVILRDRENVHVNNLRDREDSDDFLCRTGEGRMLLKRLLSERLEISPDTRQAVIDGDFMGQPFDPLIYVYVYSDGVSIHGEGIDGDCGCDCAPPGEEC